MGMNFSPMYQPVSTKTIKADGDLNISPYDLLATDVKCDTVEASEFVGGVGNFSSYTYNGELTTEENGTALFTIPAYGASVYDTDFQSGYNIGKIPYPSNFSVFSTENLNNNGYLQFIFTRPGNTNYTCTASLLKNGVEYSTITAYQGSSTGSISIPLNPDNLQAEWGFKYKSGDLRGSSGYSLYSKATPVYMA